MRNATNFVAGLIFGLGLLISGMANPAKVQNFLDVAGNFDPSLLFVMLGAVAVTFLGYRFVLLWPKPLLSSRFLVPSTKDFDRRLILGAALFGVGWGLSGYLSGTGRHVGSAFGHWHFRFRARNAYRPRHRWGAKTIAAGTPSLAPVLFCHRPLLTGFAATFILRNLYQVSSELEVSMRRAPTLAIAMTTFSFVFLAAIVLGLL